MLSCWACGRALPGDEARCAHCGAATRSEGPNAGESEQVKVVEKPCRSLSQYGRIVSALVAGMIGFCIVQAWLVLRPPVLRLVRPGVCRVLEALAVLLTVSTPINFWLTTSTSPGYVTSDADDHVAALINGDAGCALEDASRRTEHSAMPPQPLVGWRRCAATGAAMPPRSHYCRQCRQVILRFDHHCAFVNNCIGHRNHHYFLRLLVNAFVATGCESVFTVYVLPSPCLYFPYDTWHASQIHLFIPLVTHGRYVLLYKDGTQTPFASLWRTATAATWLAETRALFVLWAVATLIMFLCATLLALQLHDLSRGATYLEARRVRVAWNKAEYDQGSARVNLRAIFGSSFLVHVLPLPRAPVGDGISFVRKGE